MWLGRLVNSPMDRTPFMSWCLQCHARCERSGYKWHAQGPVDISKDIVEMVRKTDEPGTSRTSRFEQFDAVDVRDLITAYPLAWVCTGSGELIEASQLPLIGKYNEAGELIELIGHLMYSNPLYSALVRDAHATILFAGPSAYISPEHAGRRDWAPTWNYAQLRIGANITCDAKLTEYSLKLLVQSMESSRVNPWEIRELGERYQGMLGQIIGFRAHVMRISGKFKLSQDEDANTLNAILTNLPDAEMTAWVRRFNMGRH
jgi:transcriptional regulator